MEATLNRRGATPRRASNSTIDPDANCVRAKASEPEYLGKTVLLSDGLRVLPGSKIAEATFIVLHWEQRLQ